MNGRIYDARAPRRRLELVGFALLAYVPFFLSSPGKVSADTKQYLYLNPARLLARAPYLWDPHVGTGTVPHQNIGYLFPMGPYYWLMDQLGVPDWVAQRIWLGSISFAAGVGVLWLLRMLGTRRAGAIAGALVYMLTPYQVALTARLSVILLPWAALPWLVGLTARAVKRGGWRDPALFALVALVAGSVSAPSLLLVGIAPVLWLVVAVLRGDTTPRVALSAAARLGVLTTLVSIWWAIGLVTQARFGIPVLDVTESLKTVAGSSAPADILRGLGNWFLSGSDRLGRWLDQAEAYAGSWLAVATFIVPGLALLAAAVVRWRYRAYFAALVVVGTIVGAGAWPYGDPSPAGALFKSTASGSAIGLALRNTPRVVPVVVLGLAGLIGAGVSALAARRRLELVAATAVCAVVALAFWPVWEHGYLSRHLQRSEHIPTYWEEATGALDDHGDATRVLEIPGSLFAAYRWGNTVDPITPGLTDRPSVVRELLPFGGRASVDLLAALDGRMQEGTFEAETLAPLARLMRSGTVLVRSDLEYERYDTPRPRVLWSLLTDPLAPGLGTPEAFGPRTPNEAAPELAMFDELELSSSGERWPPKVALIPVEDAQPIVSTASRQRPVVLAGSGDGIVDAAAAGVLNGNEIVLYTASLDDAELRDALSHDGVLVITDTNRRRAKRWNTLRDDTGATERAGQHALRDDPDDYRLDPFAGAGDAERTVAEQRGGHVDATSYGFTGVYLPEDRPVYAFDGDTRTAWRAAGGEDAGGERLVLRPDHPVRADHLRLVQPLDAPNGRWLTKVRLHFDHSAPVTVGLDDSSRTAPGQLVRFPNRTIRRLEIELLEATPGADPVGFAEVRVGHPRVRVDEVVRMPVAPLRRAGAAAIDHRLVLVMSREREDPAAPSRTDPERALVRRFELLQPRSFSLAGTARLNPAAPDEVVDAVLGTTAPGVAVQSSGHLRGAVDARASLAFDNDPSTFWTAPLGVQEGQYVEVEVPEPVTLDQIGFGVLDDGRHSVPTRLRLEVDGKPAETLQLPAVGDRPTEESQHNGVIRFPAVTGSQFRIVVDHVRPVTRVGDQLNATVVAPVAMNVLLPGVTPASGVPAVGGECRNDLVAIDGKPVSVRLAGDAADARRGLALEQCGEPMDLGRGSHEIRSQPGLDTGIDLDRLVLASAAGGAAAVDPIARVDAPPPASGTQVHVLHSGMTSVDVQVHTDGKPYWLVLGQSLNRGWKAELADGTSLGEPRLVNGFANGWIVDPGRAGTVTIHLRWTPQRLVWVGLTVSAFAVLLCLLVLRRTRRRAMPTDDLAGDAALLSPMARFDGPTASTRVVVATAVATGFGAGLVSRPWIGALVGFGALVALRVRGGRAVLLIGAPVALALSKVAGVPELGWVAALLLGAEVVCGYAVRRGGARAPAGR